MTSEVWWSENPRSATDPEVLQRASQLERIVARVAPMLRWLAIPTWALAVTEILPALGLIAVGVTVPGWWRLLPVLVGVAGLWVGVVFLRATTATIRAATSPDQVRRDALDFSRHVIGSAGILTELETVVRGSRVGVIRRLVALWRVVTLPHEVMAYLDSLPALSWLVPPKVTATWGRFLACVWWAVGCWLALVVLVGLVLSPAI